MYTNNWGPIGSEFVFKSIFFSIHHIRISWRKEQVFYEMVLTCAYIRNLRELQPARMISIVVWWLLTVTRPWFSSRLRAFNNWSELYLLHKGGVETVDIHRNRVCGVHQYLWKQGNGQIQGYSVQLVHGGPSHTWPISSRCFHVDRTRQGWACLDIWEGGLSVHKNALYTYSSKWGSKQEELKNETWCNKWMMRWKAYA